MDAILDPMRKYNNNKKLTNMRTSLFVISKGLINKFPKFLLHINPYWLKPIWYWLKPIWWNRRKVKNMNNRLKFHSMKVSQTMTLGYNETRSGLDVAYIYRHCKCTVYDRVSFFLLHSFQGSKLSNP